MCCRETLRVKEKSFIALHNVPLFDRPLPLEVEVIRSHIHCMDDEMISHGIGVRFSKIADEDRELISTVVSDHLEAREIIWKVEATARR